MRTERLNEIFSSVKPSLVPLIQAIASSSVKKSYKAPEPLQVKPVLYCTVLYCIVLYCIVLHCTALHCSASIDLIHDIYPFSSDSKG